MTLTVNIDGWPYQITFTGRIEIARCWDCSAVAVRLVSDDATVQVRLDLEETRRQQEVLREVLDREHRFKIDWMKHMKELDKMYLDSQRGR